MMSNEFLYTFPELRIFIGFLYFSYKLSAIGGVFLSHNKSFSVQDLNLSLEVRRYVS